MSESGTLLLRIRDASAVPGGTPRTFRLDRHGAVIGRAAGLDWTLPDPDMYISSRHCEVEYVGGGMYRLVDLSTNGTYLNGAQERMATAKMLTEGDAFRVGRFDIDVLPGSASAEEEPAPEAAPAASPGWDAAPAPAEPAPPAPEPVAEAAPPAPEPAPAPIEAAKVEEAWVAPTPVEEPAAPPAPAEAVAPVEEPAPMLPPELPAIDPAGEAEPVAADGGWDTIEDDNAVDWSRGFGEENAAAAPAGDVLAQLLKAAGLSRDDVKGDDDATIEAAGLLLRQLVGGLVVMMEARARAKAQMGAQNTIFSRDGNNPIKFAMSPAHALAQMLSPPVSGFMGAERAVEDSYRDLQAHQIATLKAMQGALRSTLDRFSPDAIKKRAETKGLIARILPGARASALWEAYEREFGGVAQGSDEAFMDIFAKEFRKAYEAEAAKGAK
ncbi:type VI secretion system-associated FHA domain protein TagH [Sphingomonas montanisoli]|uniref:Type VI secretion system-associated FHA domain protein TagH n=1 Tax=Sphingomonas montanisoli TaxID=2606412 RepID=A0A5D9C734_9SPHN|nr:type VI secretion system-associated FHA domain protein TagH [Sphingomonas montanisoli]TZG27604.1 type VI secretion system-associated FHA domain protein TagH [Sphingomonas montanisoli]